MLLVIELLFLGAGTWAITRGRLPALPFRLLFGKGRYELPPTQARLFGLLIASPWPVTLAVALALAALLGQKSIGYSIVFEYAYDALVIGATVIIARHIRRPAAGKSNSPGAVSSSAKKERR